MHAEVRAPTGRERWGWAATFGAAWLVLTVVYFAFPGMWGSQKISGDGWDNYVQVRSILFDGDLTLANEYANCCNQFQHTPHPVTGRYTVAQPLGTPLLWLPFLAGTHGAALLRSTWAPGVNLEGYGSFYFVGTAYGSVVYTLAGLFFVFLFLRRRFSLPAAALSTCGVLLGTGLLFYAVFHPSYTHGQSMFAVSLFVWFWDLGRGDFTLRRWALLGALTGLVALVRAQDVGIALLPAVEAFAFLFGRGQAQMPLRQRLRAFLGCGLLASAVALCVFAPQLLTWRYLFGSLTLPQGEGFMQWSRPTVENALNVLFWSRNGLVSWHPLYWLCAPGFVVALWRRPAFTGLLLLGIFWQWYVNTICADLWAGWSFGNRRFLGISILFAYGLAAALEEGLRLVRRYWPARAPARLAGPLGVAVLVLALLPPVALNVGMTRGVLMGKVRTSESQDMRGVYRAGLNALVPGLWEGIGLRALADGVWRTVGNPVSAPAVAYQRLAHGVPASKFDTLVGHYTLYRFQPDGRPVTTRLDLRSPQMDKHLVAGTRVAAAGAAAVVGVQEAGGSRASLALPIWLLSEQVTVSLEVETDVPGTVRALFNGVPQAQVETGGGRQRARLEVPLEQVRWGINRLDVVGQGTQVGLLRVDLSSRY